MNWKFFPLSEFSEISPIWQHMKKRWHNSILLDEKFVNHLLLQFGTEKEFIGICYQGNAPVAIGIFSKSGFTKVQTFQPSQAPLGLWIVSGEIAIEKVIDSLFGKLNKTFFLVEILHQDPIFSTRPTDNNKIKGIDYIKTSFVRIEGDFETYWKNRSKNLRHNLKRQRNRLKKEKIDVKFDVIVGPDAIQGAVVKYGELETKGWKQATGTNINISNPQGKFYSNALTDFAYDQRAMVFQYHYNEKLVACDLCLKDDETLIILKTTYDEDQKTSSPAFLLLEEIIQYVFATKQIKKVEFYGKVMDWHTKWIEENDVRRLYHVNYYRSKFIKLAHDTLFKIKNFNFKQPVQLKRKK